MLCGLTPRPLDGSITKMPTLADSNSKPLCVTQRYTNIAGMTGNRKSSG